MGDFLGRIFDSTGFTAREGGGWDAGLVWLHRLSDILIWLAFMAIPLILLYFTGRRWMPYRWLIWLFAAFILACGFTHLIAVVTFSVPVYRLEGLMKAVTAVLSCATVIALVPAVPRLLALIDGATGLVAEPEEPESRLRDYIVGILAGVMALLVRTALDPLLGDLHPFIISILSVIFVAWYSGFGPAIVTLLLSMSATMYFFLPPRGSFVIEGLPNTIGAAVFFFVGVGCAFLGEAQRIARRTADRNLRDSLARQADLEAEVARRRAVEQNLRLREADLKNANAELRAAERKSASLVAELDTFLNNAPVGIAFYDTDLRYVRINQFLADVNGRSPADHVGKRTVEIVPAFPADLIADYRRVLDTGEPILNRTVAGIPTPTTSGEPREWEASLFPVRQPDGEVIGLGVVARDVTEERRAERRIRDSEDRFRTLIELSPKVVWTADAAGRITYSNPYWYELTGLTPAETAATGWAMAIHPDHRDRVAAAWQGAVERRGTFEVEVPFRRASDGSYRWHLARGQALTRTDGGDRWLGLAIDIDDRKRAAEAMAASEQFLRQVIDRMFVFVYVLTPEGVVVEANRAAMQAGGLEPTDVIGRPFADTYWWAHDPAVQADLRAAIVRAAAGAASRADATIRVAGGGLVALDFMLTPMADDAGHITHLIASGMDISDRKEAESAVRDSEARFRTLTDAMPQIAWGARPDGVLDYYNQRWYEFTGFDREAIGDESWEPILHPDDVARCLETWYAAVRSGEMYQIEYRFQDRKSGGYRWFLGRAQPQRDAAGRIVRWFGTSTDIDDSKRLEVELRQSRDRFQSLTETVPQMVWTTTPDGVVDYVNRRWQHYTGVTVDQARADGWQHIVHPDDRERDEAEWRAAIRRGDRHLLELRVRRAWDGAYRWHLVSALPVRDADGSIRQWVGSLTDIDDQKRQSETLESLVGERTAELTASYAALQQEVAERTRAEARERAASAELRRSNEDLEKFAYVASHDLQEPLRKIQAFGDRLRTRYRDQVGDQGREYIDRMLASAVRMRRLIEDLLTFSRVTSKAHVATAVDLGEILTEVLIDLEIRLAQTGGKVEVGPLPTIEADPAQMRQLFQNLVGNGLKFHKPGAPPIVRVMAVPAAGGWAISIADDGIGFDVAYTDRIFEVFQRLHGRDEYEGTGIGLAVCKKIVERHGGTLTAESSLGEGATFVITLPRRVGERAYTASGHE